MTPTAWSREFLFCAKSVDRVRATTFQIGSYGLANPLETILQVRILHNISWTTFASPTLSQAESTNYSILSLLRFTPFGSLYSHGNPSEYRRRAALRTKAAKSQTPVKHYHQKGAIPHTTNECGLLSSCL